MYSDMSKRTSSTPRTFANCLLTSVLPTPVGPANKKLPIGLVPSRSPARASLIAVESTSMAEFCPNTTIFSLSANPRNCSLSELETLFAGIRAILEMTNSISPTPTVFLRLLATCKRWKAPASSITSIALSGRKRSLICRLDSSAAVFSAESVKRKSWCSSNRDLRPFKIL